MCRAKFGCRRSKQQHAADMPQPKSNWRAAAELGVLSSTFLHRREPARGAAIMATSRDFSSIGTVQISALTRTGIDFAAGVLAFSS